AAIAGSGRCERLSRLKRRAESRRGNRARWIREVRVVEYVVELGAKFQVNGFMDWERFLHGHARLPVTRAMDQAALQVAIRRRQWYGKGRWIQVPAGQERVHAGNDVRTAE